MSYPPPPYPPPPRSHPTASPAPAPYPLYPTRRDDYSHSDRHWPRADAYDRSRSGDDARRDDGRDRAYHRRDRDEYHRPRHEPGREDHREREQYSRRERSDDRWERDSWRASQSTRSDGLSSSHQHRPPSNSHEPPYPPQPGRVAPPHPLPLPPFPRPPAPSNGVVLPLPPPPPSHGNGVIRLGLPTTSASPKEVSASTLPSATSSSPTYLLPPDSSPPSRSPPRYAYVWLVMKGDSYIPGALTSAYSVALSGSPHALVCMVTPDVSPAGRHRLSILFHSVVEVPYISAQARALKTQKQQQLYARWVEQSFTKWNALSLTDYDKVLFIDADKIVLANIDALFELPTPAATFSSPWASTYVAPSRKRGQGLLNPYASLEHGSAVPHAAVEAGLHTNSFVIIGTMVLLRPSASHYARYLSMLQPYTESAALPAPQSFGFESCHSMLDEQSLCLLYHAELSQQWTFVHQRYNYICWHRRWLAADDLPYVFHFFSTKPWVLRRTEYLDLEAWWTLSAALVSDEGRWGQEERDELRAAYEREQLEGARLDGCAWCKEDGRSDWKGHRLLDDRGLMQCPRMLTRGKQNVTATTLSTAEQSAPEVQDSTAL